MAKGKKTGGRKKGSRNKLTRALKDMILGALDNVGGQAYFVEQARVNPSAFLTLIGRVLPTELTGKDGAPLPAANVTVYIPGNGRGG